MARSWLNVSFISLLVLAVVLQRFVSPTLIWRQLIAITSWTDDAGFWHANTCLAGNCVSPLVTCMGDLQCMKTVGCANGCILEHLYEKDKVAACAYLCEMTHGYQNTQFTDVIGCMLDNECLIEYPMEDIEGDWWVLRGINCGHSGYPGGYDGYPCQHERFIKAVDDNGHVQWINNVTYCGGASDQCVTQMITTVANVSMTAPGVVHHDYTDAPLSPQSEDWRLVSWPHPDYALMLWCGRLPVLEYAGGIIISRKRTDKEMPSEVVRTFRDVLQSHGLDYDKTCPSNNDHCPF